jgi:hypothetical protein
VAFEVKITYLHRCRYIDFLESAGIPVEATCKAAKLPSANVWPGQFSRHADGGEPLTEEVGARIGATATEVLFKSCSHGSILFQ